MCALLDILIMQLLDESGCRFFFKLFDYVRAPTLAAAWLRLLETKKLSKALLYIGTYI